MEHQSLGAVIASLRKEKGMTQAELAAQLSVTDKAVSKWERDLSCPDITTLPKLAEALGTSVDALLQTRTPATPPKNKYPAILSLILKAVALAQGVALAVSAVMGAVGTSEGLFMAGLGLTCTVLYLFIRDGN